MIKIKFSKSIGVGDSSLAEILAVHEAFHLFLLHVSVKSLNSWIKSDSFDAILWWNHPEEAPWKYGQLLIGMERMQERTLSWKINHSWREGNEVADRLAKEGVSRQTDFIQINSGV
ncbi:hypothetical protein QUC31_017879 [Theobroma cacao]